MVQGLAARLPADQREIGPVVVGVTLNAVLACSFCSYPDRVHTAALRQAIPDFRVAIQTFEFHAAGTQVMAFRAVQDSGKRLMRFCQRTRRDLRASWSSARKQRQKKKDGG